MPTGFNSVITRFFRFFTQFINYLNFSLIALYCYFGNSSSYWNQGEVCLATSRLYVQRTIYDQFVKRFVELARCNIYSTMVRVSDSLAHAALYSVHCSMEDFPILLLIVRATNML